MHAASFKDSRFITEKDYKDVRSLYYCCTAKNCNHMVMSTDNWGKDSIGRRRTRGSLDQKVSRVGCTSSAPVNRSVGCCTGGYIKSHEMQVQRNKSNLYNVHHSIYTPAPNFSVEQHAAGSSFFSPNASLLSLSTSVLPCLTPLGTLQ